MEDVDQGTVALGSKFLDIIFIKPYTHIALITICYAPHSRLAPGTWLSITPLQPALRTEAELWGISSPSKQALGKLKGTAQNNFLTIRVIQLQVQPIHPAKHWFVQEENAKKKKKRRKRKN